MKVRPEALSAQLQKSLAPVYWVSGDEPFQLEQACRAIRRAAEHQGYTERQIYHADRGFDWQQLRQAADSLSLFAEKKLIELRLPTAKPGKEGIAVLQEYAAKPPEDTLLLIISSKLEPATQKTKWFKSIEQNGVLVQVWPLESARLPVWLGQQLQVRQMSATTEAIQLLADRVEGNLLAADQEIEKLLLLYGPGRIETEQVRAAVADSARFDIFDLVDEALAGDPARVTRMLLGLRSEGAEPVLILWALAREIRGLAQMARGLNKRSVEQVMAGYYVWEKRKPLVRKALQRTSASQYDAILKNCSYVDKVIKGFRAGRVWDELLELALQLAGKPSLAN